jgi:ribosomal protein L11 methyltransferase
MTDRPAWVEVCVVVGEELAESVADAMARYAPGGVALGYESIEPDPDGQGTPRGPLAVRAYLPCDASLEDRRTRILEALWHLSRITPIPEATFRDVVEEDWSLAWKKNYRPLRVGRHFVIVPSWMETELRAEDVPIRLDPGMAFGTGMHPTTQLCLQAVEDFAAAGKSVIDLGCGSGILAIGAVLLGAAPVTAVDIDPEAVRIARENFRENGVADGIRAACGSLDDLLDGRLGAKSADLVLANILAVVLAQMLSDGLGRLVNPGGVLVLSGILEEQSATVERAIADAGLSLQGRRQFDDWVLLEALNPA